MYKSLPPVSADPCSYVQANQNSIYLKPVTNEELSKLLSEMKNAAAGYDDMKPFVIKQASESLMAPLVHICNLSLSTGLFPTKLKIAKVIPIYKKGDSSSFNNYRPVSVLPVFSKLLEKVMYNRILEFIDRYSILSDYQFGFRKRRSTGMALSILIDKFHRAVDNNDFLVGLFIDLSRAFDTVSHDILLQKLSLYGIRGIALQWMKSYLTERYQFVHYESKSSSKSNTEIGVPQGSILGPLLFLIYVNDIQNISNKLSLIQFADDTSIYVTGNSLPELLSDLENEMELLTDWLKNNKLFLNVSKTKYMIMTSPRKPIDTNLKLHIDGQLVEKVSEIKFLGVVLDNKCIFKAHIDLVAAKLSKGIGILYRAKRILDGNSLKLLYLALVQPYISYCIIVWGHSYSSYMKPLQVLQKKIIRILSNVEYNAHTSNLFVSLKLMNIKQMYDYFVSIFIYQQVCNELPDIFSNYFTGNNSNRQPMNLRPMYHSKKICEFSIRVMGPRIWNAIPSNIKMITSMNRFKHCLKKYIMNL